MKIQELVKLLSEKFPIYVFKPWKFVDDTCEEYNYYIQIFETKKDARELSCMFFSINKDTLEVLDCVSLQHKNDGYRNILEVLEHIELILKLEKMS